MKNILYTKSGMKYHTRQLEEMAEIFFSELSVNNKLDYQIGLLTVEESEYEICFGNFRHTDGNLKKDLQEWVNSEDREHFCGENYYFSDIFSYEDIEGDFIAALRYNDTECGEFLKSYLKFLAEHLLNIIGATVSLEKEKNDAIVYIKNKIYVWSREFIDEKISRNMLHLTHLSYLSDITAIEEISKMTYESEVLDGKFIAVSENLENECDIELKNTGTPIMLHEVKKIRKLLEITYRSNNDGLYLLYNRKCILGFISPKNISGSYFLIEFKGNGVWKFSQENGCCSGQGIEFRGVNPKLICNSDDFENKFKRCFHKIFGCDENIDTVWKLVNRAKSQKHGTMLVFLDDMEEEKKRLGSAGFEVKPNADIDQYMEHITAIDGAILMDKRGTVYAIGTILDGEMPTGYGFDMARGARYNSAIKYSYSRKAQKNLIVVFSEDGYANLISSGKEIKENRE